MFIRKVSVFLHATFHTQTVGKHKKTKMKNIIILLIFTVSIFGYAQDKYPEILNFDVNDKTNIHSYSFLMLDSNKAIDLKLYGNKECEFNIISSETNRIILEFYQPSKLIRKGMCAAGSEKGFLYFEVDSNNNLSKSNMYLFESCLLSIETIKKESGDSGFIKYVCENFGTSEAYTLNIDKINVSIEKEEK